MSLTAILVVGVGRSGTSLAMQALERLGAFVPENVVPASQHNLRGTLEDVAVRDHMVALRRELDPFEPLRPDDWLERAKTRQSRAWIAGYLDDLARKAADRPAAIKFPLASIFLPLWAQAARQTGTDLRIVWATRRASEIIASYKLAYDNSETVAQTHYLLRSFYILREAPGGTLLLPYERWEDDPDGQMRALAETCGLDIPGETQGEVFEPSLNRAKDGDAAQSPTPAIHALDAKISGVRGTIDEIFAGEENGREAHLEGMAANLRELHAEQDQRGTEIAGMKERLADLGKKNESLRQQVAAKEQTRQTLSQRLEKADGDLGRARQAYAELTRLRDRDEQRNAAALNALTNQIAVLEDRLAKAPPAKVAPAVSKSFTRLEKEVSRLRAAKADWSAREAALRAENAALSGKVAIHWRDRNAMVASFRWRAADMISMSLRRPGIGTITLPYRLFRLFWHRKSAS